MPEPWIYDQIACEYELVYDDWAGEVVRQATALDGFLCDALGPGPHDILDVSCGVGTQALGLAGLGHTVTGSDVSAPAVDRARREAAARGLEIAFSVADMRACATHHPSTFDAVISCDNSVPHLLTDADIAAAFEGFHRSLRPGGIALITVRDYANEAPTGPRVRPFGVRETPDGRVIVFQVWDWDADGRRYDFGMYFVREGGGMAPTVHVSRGRYYAIDTDALSALLAHAGFTDIRRIDDVYRQPVLVARRPLQRSV